jgi:hypothetical protein
MSQPLNSGLSDRALQYQLGLKRGVRNNGWMGRSEDLSIPHSDRSRYQPNPLRSIAVSLAGTGPVGWADTEIDVRLQNKAPGHQRHLMCVRHRRPYLRSNESKAIDIVRVGLSPGVTSLLSSEARDPATCAYKIGYSVTVWCHLPPQQRCYYQISPELAERSIPRGESEHLYEQIGAKYAPHVSAPFGSVCAYAGKTRAT